MDFSNVRLLDISPSKNERGGTTISLGERSGELNVKITYFEGETEEQMLQRVGRAFVKSGFNIAVELPAPKGSS